jgi:hypothetical protein
MRAPLPFALALVTLAASATPLACAHAPYDPSRLDARALHDSVATPAGEARFHAIPFPPRARTRPTRPPLVLVEPILFRRELLLEDDGLVATLEDAGFSVWLVGADADVPPDARTCATGIARSIGSVARAATVDHVDVVSLGLSGAATLGALAALDEPGSPVHVTKLALVGTPLDEAYPGSFASRTRMVAGGPASALCGLDGGTGCTRAFRDPGAAPWLGALPPAEPDAAKRARERYPQVPRFESTSVLFLAGKLDGVAPTESLFPVFEAWGSGLETGGTAVHKRFFIAGLENSLGRDFDGFALLARQDGAGAVWDQLIAFLRE